MLPASPHNLPSSNEPRILYCRCAFAQTIPDDVKQRVLEGLSESDQPFEAVADLCEMAAKRDPHLIELAKGNRPLKIAACWPRAVKGLFHLGDAPLPESGVEIINMRTLSAEEVLAAIAAPMPHIHPTQSAEAKQ